MTGQLSRRGKSFLCFVDDAYGNLELWYPWLRLTEAGASFPTIGQKAEVLSVTQKLSSAGKPVTATYHGRRILVSAQVNCGVKVTGAPGIKDGLINDGTLFEDTSVVIDRNSISGQEPDDLPDFYRKITRFF